MKIQAILKEVAWKDRHIYYYRCKKCDSIRHTCHLSRARERLCVKCEKDQAPENQVPLFEQST